MVFAMKVHCFDIPGGEEDVASLAKIALAVLIRKCHAAANHALHAKAVPNVLDAKGAVNAPSVCNVWT